MARSPKYPAELRERAVRMVQEHAQEYPSEWAAIISVAEKIGVNKETLRVWSENRRAYGAAKEWTQLRRDGVDVARCTVEQLMLHLHIRGIVRGKKVYTTWPDTTSERPADLVDRQFRAVAPNHLWVADLTYVKTHSGWVYVAFVIDVFSRRIVGWQASRSLRTDLALDALEMALWTRRHEPLDNLIHHSDRGVQYLAIRYTERLAEAGAVTSVGSRGDSYDNALAESFNGLYKAELIHLDGPWHGLEDVEHATMLYIDWFNHHRLHGEIGMVPPEEYEATFGHQQAPALAGVSQELEPL